MDVKFSKPQNIRVPVEMRRSRLSVGASMPGARFGRSGPGLGAGGPCKVPADRIVLASKVASIACRTVGTAVSGVELQQ